MADWRRSQYVDALLRRFETMTLREIAEAMDDLDVRVQDLEAECVRLQNENDDLEVQVALLTEERDEARADRLRAEERFVRMAEQAGDDNLAVQDKQRELDSLRRALDEHRAWAAQGTSPRNQET